jgi:putative SOS response-associated peptidase YedK
MMHGLPRLELAGRPPPDYISAMCGRIIQSGGPLRYAIVDGLNARDSRVHNYPPRWNAAPSQELLVIRRNHKTGDVSLDALRWGLIPYWCSDSKGGRKPINAKGETVRDLPTFREATASAAASCRSTASSNRKRSRARRRSSPTRSQ